jgi:hypothetical protein
MKISEHHQAQIAKYENQLGLTAIRDILYRINKCDNTRKLAGDYSLNLYDIRYLQTIANEVSIYIHEKEHRQQLTLLYSNGVKMVA